MPAYGGQFCGEDRNGCSEIQCFSAMDCLDVPAPGVGAVCGPCPEGFNGDGEKCNGISTCILCLMGLSNMLVTRHVPYSTVKTPGSNKCLVAN